MDANVAVPCSFGSSKDFTVGHAMSKPFSGLDSVDGHVLVRGLGFAVGVCLCVWAVCWYVVAIVVIE